MKKINVKDIENLDQVKDYMDIYDFIDENGNFFNDDHYEWWQDFANQKKYLEDIGVNISDMDFDEIGCRYDQETSK